MLEILQNININKIDLQNSTYRISTDNNFAYLTESIKKEGITTPVILKKEDNDTFIIVSGYKRIASGIEAGIEKLPALLVCRNGTVEETDFLCSKLSITENAYHRELNNVEIGKGLSLLKKFITIEEIVLNSVTFFNKTLNKKIVENLLSVSCLDNSIHDLILSRKLAINTILKIKEYNSEIFNSFIDIFSKVRMGQNKQLEIITNTHEIARRDDLDLLEILQSKEINDILAHENNDENFKGNLLRQYLKKIRFPELTKTYENYKNYIKQLKIEPEIKIDPPNNFEGEKYSLSFQFSNLNEFDEKIQKLVLIQKNNSLKKLFK